MSSNKSKINDGDLVVVTKGTYKGVEGILIGVDGTDAIVQKEGGSDEIYVDITDIVKKGTIAVAVAVALSPVDNFVDDFVEEDDDAVMQPQSDPQRAFDNMVKVYLDDTIKEGMNNIELEVRFGTGGIKPFTKSD